MSDDQGKPFTPTADTLPKTDDFGRAMAPSEPKRVVKVPYSELTAKMKVALSNAAKLPRRQFSKDFKADPKLNRIAGRYFAARLRPARRRGRPQRKDVTELVELYEGFCEQGFDDKKSWAKTRLVIQKAWGHLSSEQFSNKWDSLQGRATSRLWKQKSDAEKSQRARKYRKSGGSPSATIE